MFFHHKYFPYLVLFIVRRGKYQVKSQDYIIMGKGNKWLN